MRRTTYRRTSEKAGGPRRVCASVRAAPADAVRDGGTGRLAEIVAASTLRRTHLPRMIYRSVRRVGTACGRIEDAGATLHHARPGLPAPSPVRRSLKDPVELGEGALDHRPISRDPPRRGGVSSR